MRQSELDLEMTETARRRYYKGVRRAVERGSESGTNYGSFLLSGGIGAVAERIAGELLKAESYARIPDDEDRSKDVGRAIAKNVGQVMLHRSGLSADVIAAVSGQVIIDGISRDATASTVCIEIGRIIENEAMLVRLRNLDKDVLRTWLRWRQARGESAARSGVVSSFRKMKEKNPAVQEFLSTHVNWNTRERFLCGARVLSYWIEETGIVEITTFKEFRNGRPFQRTVVVATEETKKYIDSCRHHYETLSPPKIPMVIPPKSWTCPYDGGYDKGIGDPLIRVVDGAVLDQCTREAMPLVYRVVNEVQKVPFRVNRDVLAVVERLWESRAAVPGIPRGYDLEFPKKPEVSCGSAPELRVWRIRNRETLVSNRQERSRGIAFLDTLALARRFAAEDATFFHPASLDFRGRMFTSCKSLTHQGPDLQKGLIEFSEKRRLPAGHPGMEYWLCHGANTMGLKGSVDSKAEAMRRFIREGGAEAVASDPVGRLDLWRNADSPFQFLAWCLSVPEVRAGKPIGLMVAQDGTCNGLQVLSLLLRDEVGAKAVNLMRSSSADEPTDIYGNVAKAVTAALEQIRRSGEESERFLASRWLEIGVDRGMAKRPVMIVPYNGTVIAATEYIQEALIDKVGSSHGFSSTWRASGFLAKVMWGCIGEQVVKAMEFKSWVERVSRKLSKAGVHPVWSSPTGFIVSHRYWTYDKARVVTSVGRRILKWSMRTEAKAIDKRKQANALMPNLVHSLDAACMMQTASELMDMKVREFAFVHDSYLTHADTAPACALATRKAWHGVFKDDPLRQWVTQIQAQLLDEKLTPPAYGSYDLDNLLGSRNFFG